MCNCGKNKKRQDPRAAKEPSPLQQAAMGNSRPTPAAPPLVVSGASIMGVDDRE